MSHQFKVGEIAVVTYTRGPHLVVGEEVEVIGPLETRMMHTGAVETGYRVYSRHSCDPVSKQILTTGRFICVLPDQLRKRRPPQDWVKLCNLTHLPTRLQGEVA